MKLPDGAAGRLLVTLAVLGVTAGGCGDGGVRHLDIVLVAPAVPDGCGAPALAQQVDLSALGDFVPVVESGPADAALTSARFPEGTRAFELTVLGPGGARLGVARSAELELGAFAGGSTIPMLIGPPRGFCQVGTLLQARRRPSVARAAEGVLVVGGIDALGGPVGVAEWYDPSVGGFTLVLDAPYNDLRGASAVTLVDGRVLIAWREGFQIYDPARRTFGVPTIAQGVDLHSYAQAVRLADGRVLVAGGCDADVTPPCAGTRAAAIFDPASDSFAPAAPLALARADGAAWSDGDGRVLLVGGFDEDGAPLGAMEAWDVGGAAVADPVELGVAGASAAVAGGKGGVVVAFAPAGVPASAAAALVGPMGAAGGARTAVAARAGATVTALDDGALLVVGGVDAGAASGTPEAELYRAHAARFQLLDTPAGGLGGRRREHAAVALADGSVLILGGADGATVRGDAWIYRHEPTGPWSSLPVQIFGLDGSPLVVPFDAAATRVKAGTPQELVITAQTLRGVPLGGWATLAGPLYGDVTVNAIVNADDGAGVAVLMGMTSAGDFVAVELVPGEPARVRPVVGGAAGAVVCEGPEVAVDAFAAVADGGDERLHTVRVDRRGGLIVATVDGAEWLSCNGVASARGAVAVGIVGAAGREMRVAAFEAVR